MTSSDGGVGVMNVGNASGVYGTSTSAPGQGIHGHGNGASGQGVRGERSSTTGYGVYAKNLVGIAREVEGNAQQSRGGVGSSSLDPAFNEPRQPAPRAS